MNPCTNGCQPPRSALFFRCTDRLIPDRMFPSRRHRGSIHVVCPPSCPFLLPNRPSCSLHVIPAPYRHSRDGGNLAPCLPSFPLPIVIPALYRHSRDGGNLAPCVRRLSIEAPATQYLHRSGTRCSPQRACYGRTYPVHYTYTNDAAGLVLRRANPPYRGVIEICGFSMPIVRVCCTI